MRWFKLNAKNLLGWRTDQKIIVFAVDDYGNVRVDSRKARERMDKAGLKVESRFDAFDSLETEEDLSILFETLTSVRDKNGNHPIFTALTVVANIDFDHQLKQDTYVYELLPTTFERLNRSKTWALWKEGIDNNLLFPQFHGREHLNVKLLEANLACNEYSTRVAIENSSYTSIRNEVFPDISYTAAFDFCTEKDIEKQELIVASGLAHFKQIFGWKSLTFNAPGGRESSNLHETLFNNGVNFIETPIIKREYKGTGRFGISLNYTGKKNRHGQFFLVRNCVFEPTSDSSVDWVTKCMRQIETAFRWHKPAVISSHRVNFSGHIDVKNRQKGISALASLLRKISIKWPDVVFMTTAELGNMVKSHDL